jgi:hypothetical protein
MVWWRARREAGERGLPAAGRPRPQGRYWWGPGGATICGVFETLPCALALARWRRLRLRACAPRARASHARSTPLAVHSNPPPPPLRPFAPLQEMCIFFSRTLSQARSTATQRVQHRPAPAPSVCTPIQSELRRPPLRAATTTPPSSKQQLSVQLTPSSKPRSCVLCAQHRDTSQAQATRRKEPSIQKASSSPPLLRVHIIPSSTFQHAASTPNWPKPHRHARPAANPGRDPQRTTQRPSSRRSQHSPHRTQQ